MYLYIVKNVEIVKILAMIGKLFKSIINATRIPAIPFVSRPPLSIDWGGTDRYTRQKTESRVPAHTEVAILALEPRFVYWLAPAVSPREASTSVKSWSSGYKLLLDSLAVFFLSRTKYNLPQGNR